MVLEDMQMIDISASLWSSCRRQHVTTLEHLLWVPWRCLAS